ncbi:hypothetical protein Tco_0736188 [Tanacetum coccineum]
MHLGLILDMLKKEKLYVKFLKCEFWLREVQFLGHVVNNNGIYVDPSKIKAVKNWEAPKSPTKKNKKYICGNEQEVAFQTLKDRLCNAPVLALPGGPEDFMLYSSSDLETLTYTGEEQLFSDYDCEIRYHPGKATVLADALSRKEKIKPRCHTPKWGLDGNTCPGA